MRLRIDKSSPFIAFVIFLSAGLVFRELWKSKLRVDPAQKPSVSAAMEAASNSHRGAICYQGFFGRSSIKTLLILTLGLASTGFLLWPCLTRGVFVSVTSDTFLYSAFGQYLADHHRGFEYGLSPVDQYATGQSESRFGTASVLGFFWSCFIPAPQQLYLFTYLQF